MQGKKRKEKEHVVKFAENVSCRKEGKTDIYTSKYYMEAQANWSWWFVGGKGGVANYLKIKIVAFAGNKSIGEFFGHDEEKRGIGKEKSGDWGCKRREI